MQQIKKKTLQKERRKTLTVEDVKNITQRFTELRKKTAQGPTEKVFWLHALEKSTEILFAPKIRAIIENKFRFYINRMEEGQSTLTKDKNRVATKMDKASFMRVFREVYKDNDGALILLQAVLDHLYAIKASTFKKVQHESSILVDLEDF